MAGPSGNQTLAYIILQHIAKQLWDQHLFPWRCHFITILQAEQRNASGRNEYAGLCQRITHSGDHEQKAIIKMKSWWERRVGGLGFLEWEMENGLNKSSGVTWSTSLSIQSGQSCTTVHRWTWARTQALCLPVQDSSPWLRGSIKEPVGSWQAKMVLYLGLPSTVPSRNRGSHSPKTNPPVSRHGLLKWQCRGEWKELLFTQGLLCAFHKLSQLIFKSHGGGGC